MNNRTEIIIDLEADDQGFKLKKPKQKKPWVNIVLFLLTLITTTVAGANKNSTKFTQGFFCFGFFSLKP